LKKEKKSGQKTKITSHVNENILEEDDVVVLFRVDEMVDVGVTEGLDGVDLVDFARIAIAIILRDGTARLGRPVSPLLPVLSLVKESVGIFSSLSLDEIHSLLELPLQGNVAVELLLVGVWAVGAMDIKAIVGSFVFVGDCNGGLAHLCLLGVVLLL